MPPSGGGTPAQRDRLRETEDELLEHRRRIDDKDRQIRQHTDALVRTVSHHTKEALLREELSQELAQAREAHQQELAEHRAVLLSEHSAAFGAFASQLEAEEEARAIGVIGEAAPGELSHEALVESLLEESAGRRGLQISEVEEAQRERLAAEERRVAKALQELVAAQAEAQVLTQERDAECQAASVARAALTAEQRAAQTRREHLTVEVRSQASKTKSLEDDHRGLEGKVRALQHELSRATYGVGQRDQELKVKNSELHEVRQSIACIQEEMDEVNKDLKEQCGRVQHVESSVKLSRDLGEKVRAMRGMVKESHAALGQLSGALEAERSRREQCSQGLRQQKVRTELLLQLLHHFKSRTQDLAPQTLLGLNAARLGSPASSAFTTGLNADGGFAGTGGSGGAGGSGSFAYSGGGRSFG